MKISIKFINFFVISTIFTNPANGAPQYGRDPSKLTYKDPEDGIVGKPEIYFSAVPFKDEDLDEWDVNINADLNGDLWRIENQKQPHYEDIRYVRNPAQVGGDPWHGESNQREMAAYNIQF